MYPLPARPWLLVLLLLAAAAAAETSREDTEAEITALMHLVASSGCEFQRNGSMHDAAEAADHLRLKYRRGRRHVDTAEQFIDRLASTSSWTGRPYTMICDGREERTGTWLHDALSARRARGGE